MILWAKALGIALIIAAAFFGLAACLVYFGQWAVPAFILAIITYCIHGVLKGMK